MRWERVERDDDGVFENVNIPAGARIEFDTHWIDEDSLACIDVRCAGDCVLKIMSRNGFMEMYRRIDVEK